MSQLPSQLTDASLTLRPFWTEQAFQDLEAAPTYRGSQTADVCIVGGGFTGLWAALRIKEQEPSSRVILLDRERCGGAASGRNMGFALSWWLHVEALVERAGREEAGSLLRASEEAVKELVRTCRAESIDCHIRPGALWTYTAKRRVGVWDGAARLSEELGGARLRRLSREEIQAIVGTEGFLGGLLDETGVMLHPALLLRGLRDLALRRGVEIFERSLVRDLDRDKGLVKLDSGTVLAGAIVLATNIWLTGDPNLRRTALALTLDAGATEPIPEILDELGWTSGVGITTSRTTIHGFRPTADGRIVFDGGPGGLAFGGRIDRRFNHNVRNLAGPLTQLHRLFPQMRSVKVTHAWAGGVDMSVDGLPYYGLLPGSVPIVYCYGLSGNGVGPALIGGKILASLALGQDDCWTSCCLTRPSPRRFPLEPFRFIGGSVLRRALIRKDDLEEADRAVGRVTKRIAGISRLG